MGGRVRDHVAFTEYFAFRVGREEEPSDVVDYCVRMADECGSPLFEGKLGVFGVETELAMVSDLTRSLGAGRLHRLDANGVYSVPTARQVCRRLADLGVPWLENPCRTLDEMARLHDDGVPISFSTHQVDLVRAARSGVPDAFCIDATEMGGLRRTQDFVRACAALGIDFWCYSGDGGARETWVLPPAATPVAAPSASSSRPMFGQAASPEGPMLPEFRVTPVF